MWNEFDLLPMMQANHKLFGEEITHIQAADDTWLINYFENRLSQLFYPYYFTNSKFCQVTCCGKGDIESEHLIDGGFGFTKQQCVNIGNYIIGRWYKDHWGNPQLSELTSTVVLNYIEHGYPLDENQYKIEYDPRKSKSIDDLFFEIVEHVATHRNERGGENQ